MRDSYSSPAASIILIVLAPRAETHNCFRPERIGDCRRNDCNGRSQAAHHLISGCQVPATALPRVGFSRLDAFLSRCRSTDDRRPTNRSKAVPCEILRVRGDASNPHLPEPARRVRRPVLANVTPPVLVQVTASSAVRPRRRQIPLLSLVLLPGRPTRSWPGFRFFPPGGLQPP